MLLSLPGVLKPDELALVRTLIEEVPFVDGKRSAGAAARRVKRNEELGGAPDSLASLHRILMEALSRHPAYRAGALPVHAATPTVARYRPGMEYGLHLDDPIMGAGGLRYRSDLAVTLFLNAPQEYDGGELVIHSPWGEQSVKSEAGDAVLYPAGTLHRVAPVTRGERLVALTWVQSLVRDPARRELLYGLSLAREKLLREAPASPEATQVDAAYLNLVRMWSDL